MAPVEMTLTPIPSEESLPKVRHAREVDALKAQCNRCKLKRPDTPTKDCAVRIKLTVNDSSVAWKHKHLFFNGSKCKMFQEK